MQSRPQTQTNPSADHWGWFGSGTKTRSDADVMHSEIVVYHVATQDESVKFPSDTPKPATNITVIVCDNNSILMWYTMHTPSV